MQLSAKSLAGPGYIILNVIRVINIICFMAVVAASVVMLVRTFNISQFFFFDAASHVITAIMSLFLIVSELPIFKEYFATNWPLLSPSHGFVTLGVSMIVIGLNMLGNLNKEATSQQSLGMPFWRLLIASGILTLVFGFVNIAASYIFRDHRANVSARRIRSHGAVALKRAQQTYHYNNPDPTYPTSLTPDSTGGSAKSSLSFTKADISHPHPQPAAGGAANPRFSLANPFTPIARSFRAARASLLPSYYGGGGGDSPSSSPIPPVPTLTIPAPAYGIRPASSRYSCTTYGGPNGVGGGGGSIAPPYPPLSASNSLKRHGSSGSSSSRKRDSFGPRMPVNVNVATTLSSSPPPPRNFSHLVHPSLRGGRGEEEEEGGRI